MPGRIGQSLLDVAQLHDVSLSFNPYLTSRITAFALMRATVLHDCTTRYIISMVVGLVSIHDDLTDFYSSSIIIILTYHFLTQIELEAGCGGGGSEVQKKHSDRWTEDLFGRGKSRDI